MPRTVDAKKKKKTRGIVPARRQSPLPDLPTVERIPTFEAWLEFGKQLKDYESRLGAHVQRYQLVVGDWANYGTDQWGRAAESAIAKLGYSHETVRNLAWVARRIPASLRNDALTLEDYRAVAPLEDEGEREEWLDRKQSEQWSGRRLRDEIQQSRNGHGAEASSCAEAKPVQATLTGVPVSRPKDGLRDLAGEWTADAETLIARGDELSRAQADVYLDCAARLKEAIG